jgi:hypothetical protein
LHLPSYKYSVKINKNIKNTIRFGDVIDGVYE